MSMFHSENNHKYPTRARDFIFNCQKQASNNSTIDNIMACANNKNNNIV